jgi:hypothetical protein
VAGQTFVESVARTASGDSGPLAGFGDESTLRVQLDVTAVAGTGPTLDVVVEDTLDGTNWNVIGTFAQKTAVGREVINITSLFTDRLRVRWTVAGTAPSVTFSVLAYSE